MTKRDFDHLLQRVDRNAIDIHNLKVQLGLQAADADPDPLPALPVEDDQPDEA